MIVIKSNVATLNPVQVSDVGIFIPPGGGQETLEDNDDLDLVQNSKDLLALATDNAFGVGSSTLILNDGTSDIPQAQAEDFLDNVGREGGTGITENEHQDLDTLVHNLSENAESVITRDAFQRVVNITEFNPSLTTKIREKIYTYLGLTRRFDTKVIIQYDAAGVEVERITSTYSYSGIRVAGISHVRTP